jgi:maltose O-acetyltransferase
MAKTRLGWLFRFAHRISNWGRWNAERGLRGWYQSGILARAGADLPVASGAKLNNPWTESVGDNCYVGDGVQLHPWNATITFGNNALVAAGVRMITHKHGFAYIELPMSDQGYTNAPIAIEDDARIGFQAIILPGATIGGGGVVGAEAVVTSDMAQYSVVGSVPARLGCRQMLGGD